MSIFILQLTLRLGVLRWVATLSSTWCWFWIESAWGQLSSYLRLIDPLPEGFVGLDRIAF